jgi:type II secretory pathway component PulC
MLVDHERKAILSDRGKAAIYSVGQAVAGGTIVDIKEDRIIFKRGDANQEIMLKAAIAPAAGTATPPSVPAAGPPGGQTGQTTTPTPSHVEGSPTSGPASVNREELQQRREEQRERRRQMLEQRRTTQ